MKVAGAFAGAATAGFDQVLNAERAISLERTTWTSGVGVSLASWLSARVGLRTTVSAAGFSSEPLPTPPRIKTCVRFSVELDVFAVATSETFELSGVGGVTGCGAGGGGERAETCGRCCNRIVTCTGAESASPSLTRYQNSSTPTYWTSGT